MDSFYDWVIGLAALGAAGWLGWFFRGRTHLTERRVHAEIFSRQVHLAEQDADKAIQELNQKCVEMGSHEERIEEYAGEIERLQIELQETRNQASVAHKDVSLHRGRIDELCLELDELSGTAEDTQRRALEAEREGRVMLEERGSLNERIQELTGVVQDERARAEVAEHDLAETYEIRERESAEIASERQAERKRQTESEAKLRRTLNERGATLARCEQTLLERDSELQELCEQLAELEPRVEELAELRDDQVQREEQLREQIGALENNAEERALKLHIAANERIESVQRKVDEASFENKTNVELLEEASARQDELQERLDKLKETVKNKEVEMAAQRRLAAKLESSFKSSATKAQRSQAKVEQLSAMLAERKVELKEAKSQVRSASSQNRSLASQLERAMRSLEGLKAKAKMPPKTIKPSPKKTVSTPARKTGKKVTKKAAKTKPATERAAKRV